MRVWLDRFMLGRNGVDFLNKRLFLAAAGLGALGLLLFRRVGLLSVLFAAYALYRTLSRDMPRRQQEDLAARALSDRARRRLSGVGTRVRQGRDYKFFVCPGCRSHLRVPRGKGRIQITCPRCGQRFEGKS